MVKKAVIFDCFGVLIISGTTKLFTDYPDKSAEFNNLVTMADHGMFSRQEFDQAVAEITGLPVAEVTEKYWQKGFRNENVIDWVKSLKKQGKYKIALLSNIGPNWIDSFISKDEINEMFDETVLSGEIMMAKPSAEIFEYTSNKLLLQPDECVFIDDTMKNIESAQLVGMTGVIFGTFDQAKSDVEQILGE